VGIKNFILQMFLLLSGPVIVAQKAINIRPSIGLHSPLSGISQNNFKEFVTLKNNNRIWLTLKYQIGIEYVLSDKIAFLMSYSNGNAGVIMGVEHTKPCIPGGPSPNPRGSDRFKSSAYNNKRIILGVRNSCNYQVKKNSIRPGYEFGIALDIRSNENDSGKIVLPGINQCGEEFYLDRLPNNRKLLGILLPVQINLEWMKSGKSSIMFSLFYHVGITNQYTQQIDYVTNTYNDHSFFSVKGTSWGFQLSVPIKISWLSKPHK
jgi:hypothetical protein